MPTTLSLSQYVKKRNGVPLGASHSMRNMLSRALGAKSFPIFWHYWNPIWGYYLSRNVMRPSSQFLPMWLAVLVTFWSAVRYTISPLLWLNGKPYSFLHLGLASWEL